MFLVFGTCFGLLEGFLDSRIEVFGILGVFWILGRVLDPGKCFWILESILDSGMCFSSGKCFLILGRVLSLRATVCL